MVTEKDIGFRVRVVGRSDEWNGSTGILLGKHKKDEWDRRWSVRLEDAHPSHCWFVPEQLERVPPASESEETKG
jgi:hypothetical protein